MMEKLKGAQPSVLWSGNGYHIYQPIQALILELESVFAEFKEPSRKFIQFAEQFLTNKKADPCHSTSLSFRNCMLRILGSHNSKCVQQSGVNTQSSTEIRIIQTWDGKRPAINWLLRNFRRYLIQEKIDLVIEKSKAERRMGRTRSRYTTNSTHTSKHNNDIIPWIGNLLHAGLPDHRKYALSLIVVPYLVNVKRLPYDEAFLTVKNWLDRCSSMQKLDPSFNYRIKYAFKTSQKNGFKPISLVKLKQHNVDLHEMIERI